MTDQTNGAEESAPHEQDLGEERERRIRDRAYQIWVEEGQPDGRDHDHWMRAKWELESAEDPEAEVKRLEADFSSLRERD